MAFLSQNFSQIIIRQARPLPGAYYYAALCIGQLKSAYAVAAISSADNSKKCRLLSYRYCLPLAKLPVQWCKIACKCAYFANCSFHVFKFLMVNLLMEKFPASK